MDLTFSIFTLIGCLLIMAEVLVAAALVILMLALFTLFLRGCWCRFKDMWSEIG